MPTYCPVPAESRSTGKRSSRPDCRPVLHRLRRDHRMVLERNPNYHGDRPRRLARIVVWGNIPTPKAIALVEAGQLDYLPHDFSNDVLLPDRRSTAATDPPALPHGPGGSASTYTSGRCSTRSSSTRGARCSGMPAMRRAVSYALDRAALAKAYSDHPCCADHPGGGSRLPRRPVYPIGAPDLRTARRRLAGAGKRRAVLFAPCDPSVSTAAGIVRTELARIGIDVSILRSDTCDPSAEAAEFEHADMVITTNLQRFPPERDPAPFVEDAIAASLWGSPVGPGPWNDPAFTKRLERARALRGAARVAAYTRLDTELMRMAPLVVYGAFLYDEYFAPRVGCRLFQSFYLEADLGALCVRKA